MSRHVLTEGQEVIAAIIEIGHALRYTPEEEWTIPGTQGQVDVVWWRRPEDEIPILMFEIETRPGDGLAVNATKLLGKSTDQLPKPLHLFHIVVRGGIRSARPQDIAATFAAHNYSVHLLAANDEPEALLSRVLTSHARIADGLDGVRLGLALGRSPWPAETVEPTLRFAESLGLAGLSERAYVLLAQRSETFRPSLVRKLRSLWDGQLQGAAGAPNRYHEPEQPREAPYGSFMAAAACEPIELGLLATLEPELGPRAFAVLQEWQEANHIGDRLGPFTGTGGEWTEYVLDNGAFLWALVAALMEKVPGARAWCAAQPARFLEALNPQNHSASIALLATWVMHIAAEVPGCEPIYERARKRLDLCGGVNTRWLLAPGPGPPLEERWEEIEVEPDDAAFAPQADALREAVRAAAVPARDPVAIAFDALLADPAERPADGGALVVRLARGSAPVQGPTTLTTTNTDMTSVPPDS